MSPNTALSVLFLIWLSPPDVYGLREEGHEDMSSDGCDATTCSSFEDGACSCKPFIRDEALHSRFKIMLFDVIQRVRRVVDRLSPGSGKIDKLWWGGKLGDAQKDLALLQQGFENLPELRTLASKPVQKLQQSDLPAGAWPVMVEIWAEKPGLMTTKHVFIGETGAPLVEGDNTYTHQLRSNAHQTGSINLEDGGFFGKGPSVKFSTSVSKSAPYACDSGDDMRCVKLDVKVTCLEAVNLPNTGTSKELKNDAFDLTDSYCKVRVQTETAQQSLKLKTTVTKNKLNPAYQSNTFEIPSFEQPLIHPVPTNTEPDRGELTAQEFTRFSLDEMTLAEQLTSHIFYLASQVFLTKDCSKAKAPAICKLVQGFENLRVDADALKQLAQGQKDETVKKLASRLAENAERRTAHVSALAELAPGRTTRRHRFAASLGQRRREWRSDGHGGDFSSLGGTGALGWVWCVLLCLPFVLLAVIF